MSIRRGVVGLLAACVFVGGSIIVAAGVIFYLWAELILMFIREYR